MTDLIERLKAATEGSRELDAQIWGAVNGNGSPIVTVSEYEPPRLFCNPRPDIEWVGYDLYNVAPAYTTSLDAALSLVPEGWCGNVDIAPIEDSPGCELLNLAAGVDGRNVDVRAQTSALALCIAALSAREAG
jgi:hypothetical protein